MIQPLQSPDTSPSPSSLQTPLYQFFPYPNPCAAASKAKGQGKPRFGRAVPGTRSRRAGGSSFSWHSPERSERNGDFDFCGVPGPAQVRAEEEAAASEGDSSRRVRRGSTCRAAGGRRAWVSRCFAVAALLSGSVCAGHGQVHGWLPAQNFGCQGLSLCPRESPRRLWISRDVLAFYASERGSQESTEGRPLHLSFRDLSSDRGPDGRRLVGFDPGCRSASADQCAGLARASIQSRPICITRSYFMGDRRCFGFRKARARLNNALLMVDQASVDKGNWILAQERSLELPPPMVSFRRRNEGVVMSTDPVYSRLLDARWAKIMQHLSGGKARSHSDYRSYILHV